MQINKDLKYITAFALAFIIGTFEEDEFPPELLQDVKSLAKEVIDFTEDMDADIVTVTKELLTAFANLKEITEAHNDLEY